MPEANGFCFRMAESQFYRLMEGNNASKVTKVEYVVNPKLIAKFQKRRLEMAQEIDWERKFKRFAADLKFLYFGALVLNN